MEKAKWLEERLSELLPVNYFHMVFTIDHEINPLSRWNTEKIYNLLFAKADRTLKAFGEKYLGGQIGFIAVLHTWGQDLNLHIHLHCIVVGGALSKDGSGWKSSSEDFLFPVVELSAYFRDLFCSGLEDLYRSGELVFGGSCAHLEHPILFEQMLTRMRAKSWEVYVKKPFGGAQRVLDYMGRYVHRVAISNNRIISVEAGQVRFHYRDYRNEGELKEMSLPADQFMSRFLQHVLPKGFVRIRYFGFLQGGQREAKLMRVRELLGLTTPIEKPTKESTEEIYERLTGVDPCACPVCKEGRMVAKLTLEPRKRVADLDAGDLLALLNVA